MVTASSASRWNTAAKTLEKKIKKEKEHSNQEFYSEEDALKAAREREKRWKYHEISVRWRRRGREKSGDGGDQEKTSLHRRSTA